MAFKDILISCLIIFILYILLNFRRQKSNIHNYIIKPKPYSGTKYLPLETPVVNPTATLPDGLLRPKYEYTTSDGRCLYVNTSIPMNFDIDAWNRVENPPYSLDTIINSCPSDMLGQTDTRYKSIGKHDYVIVVSRKDPGGLVTSLHLKGIEIYTNAKNPTIAVPRLKFTYPNNIYPLTNPPYSNYFSQSIPAIGPDKEPKVVIRITDEILAINITAWEPLNNLYVKIYNTWNGDFTKPPDFNQATELFNYSTGPDFSEYNIYNIMIEKPNIDPGVKPIMTSFDARTCKDSNAKCVDAYDNLIQYQYYKDLSTGRCFVPISTINYEQFMTDIINNTKIPDIYKDKIAACATGHGTLTDPTIPDNAVLNINPFMPIKWGTANKSSLKNTSSQDIKLGEIIGEWICENENGYVSGTKFLKGGYEGLYPISYYGGTVSFQDGNWAYNNHCCLYIPRNIAPTPINSTVYLAIKCHSNVNYACVLLGTQTARRLGAGGYFLGFYNSKAWLSIRAASSGVELMSNIDIISGMDYVFTSTVLHDKVQLYVNGKLEKEYIGDIRSAIATDSLCVADLILYGDSGHYFNGLGTQQVDFGTNSYIHALEMYKYRHTAEMIMNNYNRLRDQYFPETSSEFHYDSSDLTTITKKDTGEVLEWRDKSGNNNTLYPYTFTSIYGLNTPSSAKPRYLSTDFNFLYPSISIGQMGVPSAMTFKKKYLLKGYAGSFAFYLVFEYISSDNSHPLFTVGQSGPSQISSGTGTNENLGVNGSNQFAFGFNSGEPFIYVVIANSSSNITTIRNYSQSGYLYETSAPFSSINNNNPWSIGDIANKKGVVTKIAEMKLEFNIDNVSQNIANLKQKWDFN